MAAVRRRNHYRARKARPSLSLVSRNDAVDLRPGQQPAAHEHRGNTACVADVRQRVGFEQHQVRTLAGGDCALGFLPSKEPARD